ncbi:MAG: hypothetical protein ABJC89_11515 [Acidobacteriota bacterium]
MLSDEAIWKFVAFIKHSDKLPPEAQAAWQKAIGPLECQIGGRSRRVIAEQTLTSKTNGSHTFIVYSSSDAMTFACTGFARGSAS